MNYLFNFLRTSGRANYRCNPEELICVRFANFMREMILTKRCNHVFFHVSNEGSAPGRILWGARQRNMGKFAGVADYIFMGPTCLALEIKAGNKPLSKPQEMFKQWCEDCNVPFEQAGSFEEAVEKVKEKGIVK